MRQTSGQWQCRINPLRKCRSNNPRRGALGGQASKLAWDGVTRKPPPVVERRFVCPTCARTMALIALTYRDVLMPRAAGKDRSYNPLTFPPSMAVRCRERSSPSRPRVLSDPGASWPAHRTASGRARARAAGSSDRVFDLSALLAPAAATCNPPPARATSPGRRKRPAQRSLTTPRQWPCAGMRTVGSARRRTARSPRNRCSSAPTPARAPPGRPQLSPDCRHPPRALRAPDEAARWNAAAGRRTDAASSLIRADDR